MKKLILFTLLISLFFSAYSQSPPTVEYINATDAGNLLSGPGVEILNALFSGPAEHFGHFTDGTSGVGIEEGVLIATGDAKFAETFNTSDPGNSMPLNSNNGDSDLEQINGPYNVNNYAALNLSLRPTGNVLQLTFVFASDEYPQYENNDYNDAFGFFVSGPGINGMFSSNAENFAKLPNGDPISINDVNGSTNSNYFAGYTPAGALGEPASKFPYDGKTISITVNIPVVCEELYNFKIAICNTKDDNFDSGVFLKANSFMTNIEVNELSAQPSPLCIGESSTLVLNNGDPSWEYNWSNGNSGIGLSTNTVTPQNVGTSIYSVTVVPVAGCEIEREIDIDVHSPNNQPPSISGIDGTSDTYRSIVASVPPFLNNPISFNTYTSDVPHEEVDITLLNAGNYNFNDLIEWGSPHEALYLDWTPTMTDVGYNYFDFMATDNNACAIETSFLRDTLRVVCPQCEDIIYYQDRQPNNKPLPTLTEASIGIIAGENVTSAEPIGPVETGNDEVTFKAGDYILLENGWDSGPNYEGLIESSICAENCFSSCCADWDGFRFESPLPNIITPNGDGTNDYWQVDDFVNPNCAYNAQGFKLEVYDRWGVKIYEDENTLMLCCNLRSREYVGDSDLSSIHWNGTQSEEPQGGIVYDSPVGEIVADGTYFVIVTLYACGEEESYQTEVEVRSGGHYGEVPTWISTNSDGSSSADQSLNTGFNYQQNGNSENSNEPGSNADINGSEENLYIDVYPNPSSGVLNIKNAHLITRYVIIDVSGKKVRGVTNPSSSLLYLDDVAPGVYYFQYHLNDGSKGTEKLIIQR